ncbi:MAG: WD40 repeat domain-containing protein [Planctomycetota bacterium]|nr:WD40 repeat domain-containing protein [Planctomycetota bacterium]
MSSRLPIVLLLLAISAPVAVATQDIPVDQDRPSKAADKDRDLPPGAVMRIGSAWLQTGRAVSDLAVMPNGGTILSAGEDGVLRRWDLAARRGSVVFDTAKVVKGMELDLAYISLAPDGGRVVAASLSLSVLFSLSLEGDMMLLGGGNLGVTPTKVTYLSDGKTVALGGWGGEVILLDAATGKTKVTLPGHPSRVTALSGSPDAKRLASGDADGVVRIWDVESEKELLKIETGSRWVAGVEFFADGVRLIATSKEGPPHIWDLESGQKVRSFAKLEEHIYCQDLSPSGEVVAAVTSSGKVIIWAVEDGKIVRAFKAHSGEVNAVKFLPDGKGLVSGGMDGTIRIWDVETGRRVEPPVAEVRGAIRDLAWTLDGQAIAVAEMGRSIRILDASTGRPIRSLIWKEDNSSRHDIVNVEAIAISPDGGELAAISRYGRVRRWNLLTGDQKGKLAASFHGRSHDLAYLPGGSEFLTWSSANHVQRWTLGGESKEPLWSVMWGRGDENVWVFERDIRQGGPRALSVSPDGSVALTAAGEGAIRMCDTSTGRKIWKSTVHADLCRSVAFAPDGRYFASGGGRSKKLNGSEAEIRIFETATGREVSRIVGHESAITALEYSPTGSLLASSSWDGTVRLWDPERGELLATLEGHLGDVYVVAFAPDGQRLASGGSDGTILIWNPWEQRFRQKNIKTRPPAPTSEDLERAWEHLAGGDAAAGRKAIYTLANAPEETLPYIKPRLLARPVADVERVLELIDLLDDDEFEVRERTAQELIAMGDATHPSLHALLEAADSEVTAETRMRIEEILEATTFPVRRYPSEALRRSRCVEVLERIGTEEAIDLLRDMAANPATAYEGKAARAGLQRLESREGEK